MNRYIFRTKYAIVGCGEIAYLVRNYSTRAPEARMIGAQRSVSSLMKAANSFGGIGVALEPPSARRSCISFVASTLWIAAASRSTIAGGERAGNPTPCQDIEENPRTVSAAVGRSRAVEHPLLGLA